MRVSMQLLFSIKLEALRLILGILLPWCILKKVYMQSQLYFYSEDTTEKVSVSASNWKSTKPLTLNRVRKYSWEYIECRKRIPLQYAWSNIMKFIYLWNITIIMYRMRIYVWIWASPLYTLKFIQYWEFVFIW